MKYTMEQKSKHSLLGADGHKYINDQQLQNRTMGITESSILQQDSQSTQTMHLINQADLSSFQDTYDLSQSNLPSTCTLAQTFTQTQNVNSFQMRKSSLIKGNQDTSYRNKYIDTSLDIIGSHNILANCKIEAPSMQTTTQMTQPTQARNDTTDQTASHSGHNNNNAISKLNKYKRKLKKYMAKNEQAQKELVNVIGQNVILKKQHNRFMEDCQLEDERTMALI